MSGVLSREAASEMGLRISKRAWVRAGRELDAVAASAPSASPSGALNLPSRDIPQQQSHIADDPGIQANFVPGDTGEDYIGEPQSDQESDDRLDDQSSDFSSSSSSSSYSFSSRS